MKIADKKVVSFHFTLKDDKGQMIESSVGSEPLVYLHGGGGIVPGLEEALNGRGKGDKFQITLPPEKAYGQRDDRLIQRVPKTQFPDPSKLKKGAQFQAQSPQGVMIFTIVEVGDKDVVVDGNPELAGMALSFDIEITDVRDATKDELSHGHAHGPGGHHHE